MNGALLAGRAALRALLAVPAALRVPPPLRARPMNIHRFSGRRRLVRERALLPICHTPWHYPISLIK